MKGVFYRSDTREPVNGAALFTNGFGKRDATYAVPMTRWIVGPNAAPDIIPESAVCVTRYFEAAPLFPVSDLQTRSWVYVLNLDTDNMTNTQATQFNFVKATGGLGVSDNLWPMFGQERAVNSIAPGDIIGAVRVRRRFNGDDVFNGGDFKPILYTPNPGFTGPGATATMAANLINPLVNANAWIPMPTQAQGITQSTSK